MPLNQILILFMNHLYQLLGIILSFIINNTNIRLMNSIIDDDNEIIIITSYNEFNDDIINNIKDLLNNTIYVKVISNNMIHIKITPFDDNMLNGPPIST